ncbi:DUF6415 family natural product biosynthesis protein [Streptomyces sp. SGAir0957]
MPTTTPPTGTPERTIPELLEAAFSAAREHPDKAEREACCYGLSAEIHRLLPIVQAQMDALPPRTRDWYARDTAIHDAKEELRKGLSPSPMGAYLTLAELARRLTALTELADES